MSSKFFLFFRRAERKAVIQKRQTKQRAEPQDLHPKSDVCIEYNVDYRPAAKSSDLPSFYSYRCPVSLKEFTRIRDLEMFVGWAHTIATVASDWKGSKVIQAKVPPGRGFHFACPFAGCSRGANTQNEIQEHICKHFCCIAKSLICLRMVENISE